ncbi:MAG: type II/IV secretion system protein [Planctomycetes bacterium]|jgi:general secretion pathway protein E/type IV pilus assembly protein PilB|nr:ATPase, T2SS/T4P/T4SS family [Planctomycetota bacterium]NBU74769.1 type II/IV secretion system protein [Planctomycetota bacterium]
MSLLRRLVNRGLIPAADVSRLDLAIGTSGKPPHEYLLDKGVVKEPELLDALAAEFGLELVDLSGREVEESVLSLVPAKLVHRRQVMPIAREDNVLVVAIFNPYDMYGLDEISSISRLEVRPVLSGQKEIARLIKVHFGVGGETVSALVQERGDNNDQVELLEGLEADDSEAARMAQEASVVKLVNEILIEAANERASDIHIECEESGLKIRYRIDGILQTQNFPPEIGRFQAAIISRLKIMARLNIAEKRLPQDGRIKMRVQGREIDVRVSIIPMVHGEGICMRLLDKGRMVFNLTSVGMLPDTHRVFKQVIDRPHGIVLVTGPTGSGKSTTLYSALNEIKDDTTKIITVEDPVEYQQPGISQIQTHSKIGLTFAAALRSILRHDPDVILIGEMRDLETSESAIQASLTGHMVFSTLHTNDAPSAFTRLIDMGVEPFLVSSTVEGVMAQRLVRTICKDCKIEYEPDPADVPPDFPGAGGPLTLFKGAGCRACRQTGFRGRLGLFELLINSDALRELVIRRENSMRLRQVALQEGMVTLRKDGWRKVLAGMTTLEEVCRVTAGDVVL